MLIKKERERERDREREEKNQVFIHMLIRKEK